MTDKTITLASIREDIEEKYGHTPIDLGSGNPVLLVNPTRLSDSQRQGLRQYQDRMQALAADGEKEDEVASEEDLREQVALMRSLLETVAESPAGAARLLGAIDALPEGDRILAAAAIVERYMGQQGEASPSES